MKLWKLECQENALRMSVFMWQIYLLHFYIKTQFQKTIMLQKHVPSSSQV